MILLGAFVAIGGLIIASCLLAFTARNAVTCIAFAALALTTGIAIPNFTRITHWGAETGEGKSSIGADFQQAVTEVKDKATQVQIDKGEVSQIKNEVQTLANQIADANGRVTQSEKIRPRSRLTCFRCREQ